MQIRGAMMNFKFDRSTTKFSVLISQLQHAQASLVKHGSELEKLDREQEHADGAFMMIDTDDLTEHDDHGQLNFGPEYKSDDAGDGANDDVDLEYSIDDLDKPSILGSPEEFFQERTKATPQDLLNIVAAAEVNLNTDVVKGLRPRRELYDSGATNMFRQK